jgi:hypothetical protein
MKGFLGFCLAVLVVYTIYYDLQYGTVPRTSHAAEMQDHTQPRQHQKQQMPSEKVKVRPGDTVLSIDEKVNGNGSAPIEKVVRDFKKLNPGADINEIQIGETYKFPVYDKNRH